MVSREMADWIDGRYRGYLKGEVSEVAICGEMVQMYERLREEIPGGRRVCSSRSGLSGISFPR